MAKCLAPAMSAEVRGRIGGIVFNSWRGVRYIKAKTGPAQPRSQKQLRLRAIAIGLARRWQIELQTIRDQWNVYAQTHTTTDWTNTKVRATGMNWYVALCTRMLFHNDVPPYTPPAIPAPVPLTNFAATGGSQSIVVTWTSPADDDLNAELWLQGPYSPGSIGSLVKANWKTNASANAATTTISGLAPGHYSVYGRMYDTTTGLVSTYLLDTAEVTT
jgi:hypothetical protein